MITKYINSGGFAIILLCFLLPLVSIKCQQSDYSIITFYGYDFIVGKSYKANNKMFDDPFGLKTKNTSTNDNDTDIENEGGVKELDRSDDGETETEETPKKKEQPYERLSKGVIKPNIYMLLLLATALGGFILTLVTQKSTGGPVIVLASCVVIFLIIFSVTLKYQFNFGTPTEYEAMKMIFRFAYEIGYWLMLIAALGLIIYNANIEVKKRKPQVINYQPPAPLQEPQQPIAPDDKIE